MVPLFIAAALAYGAASFFYGAVQANDANTQAEKKSWPRWVLLVAGLALLYGAWSSPAWGLVAAGGLLLLPAGCSRPMNGAPTNHCVWC